MTGTPAWAWAAAVGVILGLLAADLALSRGQPTIRRAVLASAGWVAAAVAFGGILLAWRGGAAGQEYFTAYLVEKALSIDNVFVFALLFQAFAVPAAHAHAGVPVIGRHFAQSRPARPLHAPGPAPGGRAAMPGPAVPPRSAR